MKRILITILACALGAVAANIDGKWSFEIERQRKAEVVLDLKSDGGKLAGAVKMSVGRGRGREVPIQDGKIEGDSFTFTTVMKGREQEVKTLWTGTVKGDTLEGTRQRDGARRGQPFTAKRAN